MKCKLPDSIHKNISLHANLRRITILFSALTILSAAFNLFTHITVPGVTPLLLGITMFLFGYREFNLYSKFSQGSIHLYLAVMYIIIFIFDLIAAISQFQAAM